MDKMILILYEKYKKLTTKESSTDMKGDGFQSTKKRKLGPLGVPTTSKKPTWMHYKDILINCRIVFVVNIICTRTTVVCFSVSIKCINVWVLLFLLFLFYQKTMLFHGNNSLIYIYKYTHYHTLNNTHMASQTMKLYTFRFHNKAYNRKYIILKKKIHHWLCWRLKT